MPNKLFGVTFGRNPSPQVDTTRQQRLSPHLLGKNIPITVNEITRPSMDHIRSLSRKDRSKSKDKEPDRKSSSKDPATKRPAPQGKPVQLEMIIESPPALMHDTPQQSTGALISGRLQLTPLIQDAVLTDITMYLECTTFTKRPVQDRCRECSTQVNDLYEWRFLDHPRHLKRVDGMQELPFSHLIPGHIPATTHGHNCSIDYSLHVRAHASDGQEIEFRRELIVKRALLERNDKNSVRVFPPTDFTVHVTLPSIIHPIGEFPVTFRMLGMTQNKGEKQNQWHLRKLTWRIEENEESVSAVCSAHAHKLGGEGKGVRHEHSRDIGMDEVRGGWKHDPSDGQIDGEFMAHINHSLNPQSGVEAGNGLKISHQLTLELVIAEMWTHANKPGQPTTTGAARVLRTQFNLHVTERGGQGISWDIEQPPMYEDVPASPPQYQTGGGSGPNRNDDVEHLSLDPHAGPSSRRPTVPESPPQYERGTVIEARLSANDLDEDIGNLRLDSGSPVPLRPRATDPPTTGSPQ